MNYNKNSNLLRKIMKNKNFIYKIKKKKII